MRYSIRLSSGRVSFFYFERMRLPTFGRAKQVGIPFRMHETFNPEAYAVTVVYNTEGVYRKKKGAH